MLIKHVEALCHKVNKMITAFSRLTIFMSMQQAQAISNAVILSNFSYCPLIWMFCNTGDCTHTRALKILHKGYESSLQALLTQNGSNGMHSANLQKLMTEIFQFNEWFESQIVWEFHKRKYVTYSLRIQNLRKPPPIKTVTFGLHQ